MQKTRDYEKTFRGFDEDDGVYRVRLYEDESGQETPVVVISDLPENTSTSVTNIIEVLAAEVAEELGVVWADTRFIEHVPRTEVQLQEGIPETFARVTFSAFKAAVAGFVEIRPVFVGRVQRPSFGKPEWRHATREEVAEMLGEDIGGDSLPAGRQKEAS